MSDEGQEWVGEMFRDLGEVVQDALPMQEFVAFADEGVRLASLLVDDFGVDRQRAMGIVLGLFGWMCERWWSVEGDDEPA